MGTNSPSKDADVQFRPAGPGVVAPLDTRLIQTKARKMMQIVVPSDRTFVADRPAREIDRQLDAQAMKIRELAAATRNAQRQLERILQGTDTMTVSEFAKISIHLEGAPPELVQGFSSTAWPQ